MPSRAEAYKDQPLPLPENQLPALTGILMRAGPGMAGGMGEVGLTSQELTAWQRGAGVTLTPWEFETVLMLSHHYVSMRAKAASPECPAPWLQMPTAREKPAVAKRVRSLLRD